MRIVAGKAKNKKIKSQKGHMVRPTMEKIKDALFNILQPHLADAVFLDLYSGTGNIALEAISRGVKRAVMIEHNNAAVKIIIENVNNIGFSDQCRAYKNDALRAIEILEKKNETFDIIFMDPPYTGEYNGKTIKKVDDCKILKKDGLLISEHYVKERLDDKIGNLKKIEERAYGDKILTFYSY